MTERGRGGGRRGGRRGEEEEGEEENWADVPIWFQTSFRYQ